MDHEYDRLANSFNYTIMISVDDRGNSKECLTSSFKISGIGKISNSQKLK